LVSAPATPAERAALKPAPQATPSRLRYDQSAKYAPNTSEGTRIWASVGTSTTKPQSIPSPLLSALTQPMAMVERNDSFFLRGSPDPTYSGRRESQGLKVKKSGGLRATERMSTGATRLKTDTAAVTPQTMAGRARTALPIPRSVCPMVVKVLRTIRRPSFANAQDT